MSLRLRSMAFKESVVGLAWRGLARSELEGTNCVVEDLFSES